MTDLTRQVVVCLIAYVLVAVVHGCTLAAPAVAVGDQGLRYDGPLRVSRYRTSDMLGTAAGVRFGSDGFKPLAGHPLSCGLVVPDCRLWLRPVPPRPRSLQRWD